MATILLNNTKVSTCFKKLNNNQSTKRNLLLAPMIFSELDDHLGRHLEFLQMLFYFILRINEQYLTY